MERAIIASTYDLEGRLEKFSYIAHMARPKGSITASKTPVDKILNGTEEAQATSTGLKRVTDGAIETRRPRKRMLDINRAEISNKTAKSDASLTRKTRAAGKQSPRETAATESQLDSSGKVDSRISDDSGYGLHRESPKESSGHIKEARAATAVAKKAEDSKTTSHLNGPSSQDEGFESQDIGSYTDEPKKGGLDEKLDKNETSSQNEGGAKMSRENAKRSVESNTLKTTPNLKVVRKRRAREEDTLTASDGLPDSTGFSRRVESTDSEKKVETSRRQNTVASAVTIPSFSMSQPVPSLNRSKFAPPTKARAEGVNYTFDDFYRDLIN